MPSRCYLNLMTSVVFVVFLWGCAGFQPAFNPKYLSSSAPELPNSRIEMTQEVADAISMVSIPGWTANASIHWISDDSLILNIGAAGKDGHYATYSIIPSSGKIKKLKAAAEKGILKRIDDRIDIQSTESQFMKVVRTINQYLFYRGKKTPYAGYVEDGNQRVDISLKVDTSGNQKSKIKGKIKNKRNGTTIPVKWSSKKNGYNHQSSVEGLFRDFRISPDGRYYIIGATYLGGPYLYDSYLKRKSKPDWLMRYYAHHAITVDPAWQHIALLRSQNLSMGPDNRYWIEIHDFSIAGR